MPIDFYYHPWSAPCRSVLLTAKAIGVELNLILVDIRKKQQLRPEFSKINPQNTIPTLVDNDVVLWESRAIITYLIKKYAKHHSLYPKDLQKRAVIDQRLYFDMEKLYPGFADCYYPMIFSGASSPDPKHLSKAQEAYKTLDYFLKSSEYLAGDYLTVADLALVATVSTFDAMNFDLSPYKNVVRWYEKMKKEAPGYEEVNGQNVASFKEKIDALTKKLEDKT